MATSTKAFLASVFYSVETLCLLENNWKIRQLRKKKKKCFGECDKQINVLVSFKYKLLI